MFHDNGLPSPPLACPLPAQASSPDALPRHFVYNEKHYFRPPGASMSSQSTPPKGLVDNKAVRELHKSVAATMNRHHSVVNNTSIIDGTNKVVIARQGLQLEPPKPVSSEAAHRLKSERSSPIVGGATNSKAEPATMNRADATEPLAVKPRSQSNPVVMGESLKGIKNPRIAVGNASPVTISQPPSAVLAKAEIVKAPNGNSDTGRLSPQQEVSSSDLSQKVEDRPSE